MKIEIEVSVGELLDKISILEIKKERIQDRMKLMNIEKELEVLLNVKEKSIPFTEETQSLYQKLKRVNEDLWEIEDRIRDCERQKDFSRTFIELARSVYKENDLRCYLKRELNQSLGSRLMEEKSYAEYSFNA
jgi:lipid A disaccharide synthetase